MPTLSEMKQVAKDAVKAMITEEHTGEADRLLFARGVHPDQANKDSSLNALVNQLGLIDGAANTTALKALMNTFLTGRADGDNWRKMFGPGEDI